MTGTLRNNRRAAWKRFQLDLRKSSRFRRALECSRISGERVRARRVMKSKTKTIGILTAGGDCPGLNSCIRGVAKAAMHYGIKVIGIQDGFRGLVENRTIPLDSAAVSGLLTQGGTLLGTGRDKPHKIMMGGKSMDMTDVAVANMHRMNMDCLVCLGGNGTQKNALRLRESGDIPVLTCPRRSTTTWLKRTSASASTRPWRSPPKPSIGCTPRRPATTASSSAKSWATTPAGSLSALGSRVVPT
jgi:hypothetical protein